MGLPFPMQEGEVELTRARRHWLYLYPRLFWGALWGTVPVAALWYYALPRFNTFESNIRLAIIAGSGLWLLYWLVKLYFLKYRYDNDIWLVTNQRLVDSVKNHWFHLQLSSASLADIQDTTVARSGFLNTLFNFGDIELQTAGAATRFTLRGIPKPTELQALIDRARNEARGGQTP